MNRLTGSRRGFPLVVGVVVAIVLGAVLASCSRSSDDDQSTNLTPTTAEAVSTTTPQTEELETAAPSSANPAPAESPLLVQPEPTTTPTTATSLTATSSTTASTDPASEKPTTLGSTDPTPTNSEPTQPVTAKQPDQKSTISTPATSKPATVVEGSNPATSSSTTELPTKKRPTTKPPTTTTRPTTSTTKPKPTTPRATNKPTQTKRQTLLASSDRVGFGAATTGGSNEVVVSNVAEFIAAVSKPNNYVRLAPSLAGQKLLLSDTVRITADNITIDGSDAPGAVFTPSPSFQPNRVMIYATKPNIIVNDITLKASYFPNGANNNVGGIRFSSSGIWVNKVTVSGLWDDAFDVVLSANNATFSKIKTFNTSKSMNMWFPPSANHSISIHSSDLAALQRNPWNQGASRVHMWNNYIHSASSGIGPMLGQNAEQAATNKYQHKGPANIISEHNVISGAGGSAGILIYNDAAAVPGRFNSVNDTITGRVQGASGSNATYTKTPTLFPIPYGYNVLPTAQTKAHVLANAGASR